MEGSLDQNIAPMGPPNQATTVNRRDLVVCPGREGVPWFENGRVEIPHQQIEAAYFKYENEMAPTGAFPEIPTAIQWWRDTSTIAETQESSCKDEPHNIGGYQLIGNNLYPKETDSGLKPSLCTKKANLAKGHPLDPQTSAPVEPSDPKKSPKVKKGRKSKTTETKSDGTKQRLKQPEKWKVNVKKNARLRGEEYIGVGGKLVPAKVMGPPCDCRMRCNDKIDEESRKQLHNVFWKTCTWEQRKQYIALSVKESPKQRTRCRGNVKSETRRQVTFTYSLLVQGEFITVCKLMFLSTFAVSEKFVRHAMDKKRSSPGGIIGPDQRGRHTPKTKKSEDVRERVREHIKSFPTDKSPNPKEKSGRRYLDSNLSIAAMHKLYVQKCQSEGVPESDIVKESYYREMFKNEFNLSFKPPEEKKKQLQVANHFPDNKVKM